MLLSASSCYAVDSAVGSCDTEASLAKFLGSDSNWTVVRESGDFAPILGLKVFESKFWVSSYGADYFPATIRMGENSFVVEDIVFRVLSPVAPPEDPARLVRDYDDEGVKFQISLTPDSCEIGDELTLEISSVANRIRETLKFVKS